MSARLKIIGLLAGAGIAFYGVQERRLASAASETPQRLTCAQLGEHGYGDNAHVVLTDFLFTTDFVYNEKSGRWTQVWIPAVPLDSEYADKLRAAQGDTSKVRAPRPVLVIVTSTSVADQRALSALEERDELEGVVVNVIDKIDGQTRNLLEGTYGDVSRAQILEVGRTVKGSALTLGIIGGGAALGLVSLAGFFRRKRLEPTPGGPPPLPHERDRSG